MAHKRRDILLIASVSYASLLGCWTVMIQSAEHSWLGTLLLYLPQHIWAVPPAILGLTAFRVMNRRAMYWNIAALSFVLVALMGFCVPVGRLFASGSGISLRVMTFNVHHCSAGIEAVANAVKRENPDVVCFQEVSTGDWSSEIPQELANLLPGWKVAKFRSLATLSKYPIVSQKVHEMQPRSGRVALETEIDLEGRQLAVLNTHLNTAKAGSLFHRSISIQEYMRNVVDAKSFQVKILMSVVRDQRSPVVIMGDFNNPPRGMLYHRFTSGFADAFRCAGFGYGYTYKSSLPVMRIDYVLAGDGIKVKKAFVPRCAASDHRPMVADLVVADSERK